MAKVVAWVIYHVWLNLVVRDPWYMAIDQMERRKNCGGKFGGKDGK